MKKMRRFACALLAVVICMQCMGPGALATEEIYLDGSPWEVAEGRYICELVEYIGNDSPEGGWLDYSLVRLRIIGRVTGEMEIPPGEYLVADSTGVLSPNETGRLLLNPYKREGQSFDYTLGYNWVIRESEEGEFWFSAFWLDRDVNRDSDNGGTTTSVLGTLEQIREVIRTGDSSIVKYPKIEKITGTDSYGMAIKEGGWLYVWGDNQYGQLGLPEKSYEKPTAVKAMSSLYLQEFYAAETYSLLVKNGEVYSAGDNRFGQLGRKKEGNAFGKVEGPEAVVEIIAGSYHSMARDNEGRVWAWGRGDKGQLGRGDKKSSRTARVVEGLPEIKSISAVGNDSFALDYGDNLYAWGEHYGLAPQLLCRQVEDFSFDGKVLIAKHKKTNTIMAGPIDIQERQLEEQQEIRLLRKEGFNLQEGETNEDLWEKTWTVEEYATASNQERVLLNGYCKAGRLYVLSSRKGYDYYSHQLAIQKEEALYFVTEEGIAFRQISSDGWKYGLTYRPNVQLISFPGTA